MEQWPAVFDDVYNKRVIERRKNLEYYIKMTETTVKSVHSYRNGQRICRDKEGKKNEHEYIYIGGCV